jgi:hypothetical protein
LPEANTRIASSLEVIEIGLENAALAFLASRAAVRPKGLTAQDWTGAGSDRLPVDVEGRLNHDDLGSRGVNCNCSKRHSWKLIGKKIQPTLFFRTAL